MRMFLYRLKTMLYFRKYRRPCCRNCVYRAIVGGRECMNGNSERYLFSTYGEDTCPECYTLWDNARDIHFRGVKKV